MSKQRCTRTALAIAISCLAVPVFAQGNASPQGPSSTKSHDAASAARSPAAGALSAPDRKFMQDAAIGGLEEVELGKLAQQKAASDDVKQFGQRMSDDHAKANDKLQSIASAKGVTLPTRLDKKAQADVDKLSTSKHFDRDYMAMMVKDHEKDVGDFRKQSKSAKDPDLKEFASSTLPTLQEHLKLAEDTNKAVKTAKS